MACTSSIDGYASSSTTIEAAMSEMNFCWGEPATLDKARVVMFVALGADGRCTANAHEYI